MARQTESSMKSSERLAGETQAAIKSAVEVTHVPSVRVTAKDGTVMEVPAVGSASVTADSKGNVNAGSTLDQSWWSKLTSKITLPMGLTMLLFAAGVVALVFAFKYASRSSAAVSAVVGLADREIAELVRRHEKGGKVEAADLERIRGIVAARK